MKKLYRKGTVHPSPPAISDQLSFLPATILTLAAALSPEDREVLAYLISGAAKGGGGAAVEGGDHPPLFTCSCFSCYMSYWIRWDSSPNQQLIHEIIDAFEDWLAQSGKSGKSNRKEKRNNKRDSKKQQSEESISGGGGDGCADEGSNGDGIQDEEKGSVRRFVSFIGERIWGAWGQ
ncbi:neurogenic protein mastermind [Senna tora]|uniref:Neurogenic protein mastermind n=1 Tax=Senna tora TaxID=362788 RepID=A0A834X9X6_9FABA|nr:neurogenic protein mastermind [Senna tora]